MKDPKPLTDLLTARMIPALRAIIKPKSCSLNICLLSHLVTTANHLARLIASSDPSLRNVAAGLACLEWDLDEMTIGARGPRPVVAAAAN